MRPPRYHFPDEVRDATRSMAAVMVADGSIPETHEQLDRWITERPDTREPMVRGGYGTHFTAEDLFPLLHVMIQKAGGPAPRSDAPPRASKKPLLIGLVLVALIVLAWIVFATTAAGAG
jgi:hypothetical protein